jgi:hypothetical protein
VLLSFHELDPRVYIVTGVYMIAASLAFFALTMGLLTDRFPEVQAIANGSRVLTGVENLLMAVFRLVGATFPLLGERSGAITCLGDNRSTDIHSKWSFVDSFDLSQLSRAHFIAL